MRPRVLGIIRLSGSAGIPETVIAAEYRVRHRAAIGELAMADALMGLEDAGYIVKHEDPLTGDTIWKVTAKGANE
jgi:hypothetical protein